MKTLFALLILSMSVSGYAASKRVITCKGESSSNIPDYREFRLNVNFDEKDNSFKATIGESYTILGFSFIWKADLKKDKKVILVKNLNKSFLELKIDLTKQYSVHNVEGFEASVKTKFKIFRPYMDHSYDVEISDGKLACDVSKKLLSKS